MKFSTDIKTKVLQCILYSIFNNVPQNINLITNNNIKFRNALSMATNDARNVKIVYDTVSKIIGE